MDTIHKEIILLYRNSTAHLIAQCAEWGELQRLRQTGLVQCVIQTFTIMDLHALHSTKCEYRTNGYNYS